MSSAGSGTTYGSGRPMGATGRELEPTLSAGKGTLASTTGGYSPVGSTALASEPATSAAMG